MDHPYFLSQLVTCPLATPPLYSIHSSFRLHHNSINLIGVGNVRVQPGLTKIIFYAQPLKFMHQGAALHTEEVIHPCLALLPVLGLIHHSLEPHTCKQQFSQDMKVAGILTTLKSFQSRLEQHIANAEVSISTWSAH